MVQHHHWSRSRGYRAGSADSMGFSCRVQIARVGSADKMGLTGGVHAEVAVGGREANDPNAGESPPLEVAGRAVFGRSRESASGRASPAGIANAKGLSARSSGSSRSSRRAALRWSPLPAEVNGRAVRGLSPASLGCSRSSTGREKAKSPDTESSSSAAAAVPLRGGTAIDAAGPRTVRAAGGVARSGTGCSRRPPSRAERSAVDRSCRGGEPDKRRSTDQEAR